MSGAFSTIPGKAPLARFAFLPVRPYCASIRPIAFALIVTSLAFFHALPAMAQHRFNVPTSERGLQNAKQAAQIRLLEKWAGLVKTVVTVTEDGKLGVGTNAPVRLLDVRGEGVFQGRLSLTPYGKAPVAGIRTWHVDNVLASGTTNDYKLRIFYQPDLETGGSVVIAAQANGHVGIGTDAPSQKLHVIGNGLFTGSLSANAFYQQSDLNLKQNITLITSPFTLLNNIEGKRFYWKAGNRPAYGVIAQDVERIMPEAVRTDENGIKSVDYSQMIAPLIEAVKQLENRVRTLEAAQDRRICDDDGYHEKNGVMYTRGLQ